MDLTIVDASRHAKDAAEEALGGPLTAYARSRYVNEDGKRAPKWAATRVRTEVYPVMMDAGLLPQLEHVLARLPGVVATGRFQGVERRELRPAVWIIREMWASSTTATLPVAVTEDAPVLDRGHVHACAVCGRRFAGSRSDARYCSNACRQRAYRQRGGGPGGANPPG